MWNSRETFESICCFFLVSPAASLQKVFWLWQQSLFLTVVSASWSSVSTQIAFFLLLQESIVDLCLTLGFQQDHQRLRTLGCFARLANTKTLVNCEEVEMSSVPPRLSSSSSILVKVAVNIIRPSAEDQHFWQEKKDYCCISGAWYLPMGLLAFVCLLFCTFEFWFLNGFVSDTCSTEGKLKTSFSQTLCILSGATFNNPKDLFGLYGFSLHSLDLLK